MYQTALVVPLLVWQAAAAAIVQQPLKTQSPLHNEFYDLMQILEQAEIIPQVIDRFEPQINLNISWSAPNTTVEVGNTLNVSDLSSIPNVKFESLAVPPPLSWTDILKDKKNKHGKCKKTPQLTLVLTDPDAPSRENPENGEFAHWIATNIPLSRLQHTTGSSMSGASTLTEIVNTLRTLSFLPSSDVDASKHHKHHKGKKHKKHGKKHGKKKHHDHEVPAPYEVLNYTAPTPPPKTGKHRYVFLALAPLNSTTEPLYLTAPTARPHWGYAEKGHGARDWMREMGLGVVGANFFYAENEEQ
ncbi:hypothetical protein MBLNU457_g0635t2 [Dothideomycetes sp. NU457]